MPEPPSPRARLAEQAAARAARGAGPGALLPRLRLLTTAELLVPAAPCGARDLDAELDALCTACRQAVRRRPGWLYAMLPAMPLPVALRPRLLQAAVLCMLRGVLRTPDAAAVVACRPCRGAVLFSLHGGAARAMPRDTTALLARLAAEAGGTAVFNAGAGFAACLRLPLAAGAPRPCTQPGALLRDRFSLPYLYLAGYTAGPDG